MLLCMPHGIESAAYRSDIAYALCHQKMNTSSIQSTRLFTLLAAKFLERNETPATDAIFMFLTEVLKQAKEDPSADTIALKRLLLVESRAIGQALRRDSVSPGLLFLCLTRTYSLNTPATLARSQFICAVLDVDSAIDCALARDYCDFWNSRLPSLLARSFDNTLVRVMPTLTCSRVCLHDPNSSLWCLGFLFLMNLAWRPV